MFYLPKRLVGKSKATQLQAELVKTNAESKVSAVQVLPGLKFCVCFSSPSVQCAFDINGLNFWGLSLLISRKRCDVKAVFVDCAPPQMPGKFIYDALAPCGRVISVKCWGKVTSSKSVKVAAKSSLQEPALPGSSKPESSSSSSHLHDLREKLDHLKKTFVPPTSQARVFCIILYNIKISIQSSKCLLFFLYFCFLINYRTILLNISLTVK